MLFTPCYYFYVIWINIFIVINKNINIYVFLKIAYLWKQT